MLRLNLILLIDVTFSTPTPDFTHLTGRSMRHEQKACPLCGERIEKTARGGRRKQSCQHCGATINKLLTCDRCGTKRVWQGKKGAACSGCGAPQTHN
jgi:uncharacterized protein with PIN domain